MQNKCHFQWVQFILSELPAQPICKVKTFAGGLTYCSLLNCTYFNANALGKKI